jgi:putative membrane protein
MRRTTRGTDTKRSGEMEEIIVEKERRHGLLFRFVVNTVALFIAGQLIPGVHIDGVVGLIIAVILLAIVNTFVRPVLLFMTLPLTVLTLGLFLLVVNGLTLMLAAWLAGGAFDVDGLGAAILAWLVVWVVNWALTGMFKRERVRLEPRD